MHLPNKIYEICKYTAQVGLPALATLYATLGAVWGIPSTDAVVKTIVAFNVALGALLVLNQAQYNSSDAKYDGTAVVQVTPEGEENFISDINFGDLTRGDVTEKKQLLLKVEKAE